MRREKGHEEWLKQAEYDLKTAKAMFKSGKIMDKRKIKKIIKYVEKREADPYKRSKKGKSLL